MVETRGIEPLTPALQTRTRLADYLHIPLCIFDDQLVRYHVVSAGIGPFRGRCAPDVPRRDPPLNRLGAVETLRIRTGLAPLLARLGIRGWDRRPGLG